MSPSAEATPGPSSPEIEADVRPTFHEQFAHHAAERGDVDAIIDATGVIAFAELESRTNQLARLFAQEGVGEGDFVLISTPVGSLMMLSAIAAWKIGAVPMPVSDRMVQGELNAIVELGRPALAVDTTDRSIAVPRLTDVRGAERLSDAPLPAVVAPQLKVPTSGGSTGRPKLILSGAPADPASIAQLGLAMGVPEHGICLITAALSHNAPFSDALAALTLGSTTVLMERFDAETALQMIEQHRATWVYAVPAMMQRIWKLPDEVKFGYDLSSVETFFHVAAPCPQWLKREWIDWLGPEVIYELYGPTEGQAATTITGTEWLEHPGSVGTAKVGEVSIRDESGRELPVGEIGEVWLRRGAGEPPSYHYLGARAESADDGWETVGDIGRLDEDGYLYLTDRRADMLLVGGVNVYPAEIEAAVDRHPAVLASCCVGLEDPELGKVPALVVETADGEVPDDLDDFLTEHLSRVKRPRRVVGTTRPLRDAAGKIRKREIKTELLGG
ncbi:AMP-binding protein [Brevibacterium daeguense]|uniref:AMP-binding protein n=1 Tax=Brevibacterium daeguense TaxID=909936 RepID=A0ABP8EII9_9MICO|nr:AMP-binding protein [Brevibacterium daeguense]